MSGSVTTSERRNADAVPNKVSEVLEAFQRAPQQRPRANESVELFANDSLTVSTQPSESLSRAIERCCQKGTSPPEDDFGLRSVLATQHAKGLEGIALSKNRAESQQRTRVRRNGKTSFEQEVTADYTAEEETSNVRNAAPRGPLLTVVRCR